MLLRRLKVNEQANKEIDISRKLEDWLIDCLINPWVNVDTSLNKDVEISFDDFEKWCLKTKIHTFSHALQPLKSNRVLMPRRNNKRKRKLFETNSDSSSDSDSDSNSDSDSDSDSESESDSESDNESSDNSSEFVYAPNLIPLLYQWMRKSEEKSEEKSEDDIDPLLLSNEILTTKDNTMKPVQTPERSKDLKISARHSPDNVAAIDGDNFGDNVAVIDYSKIFDENQDVDQINADSNDLLQQIIKAGLGNSIPYGDECLDMLDEDTMPPFPISADDIPW